VGGIWRQPAPSSCFGAVIVTSEDGPIQQAAKAVLGTGTALRYVHCKTVERAN
jgi:hypothetical protein